MITTKYKKHNMAITSEKLAYRMCTKCLRKRILSGGLRRRY